MTQAFHVLPDVDAVATATADRLVAAGRNAIRRRGRFVLALTGGSTPLAVCPILVKPPRIGMLDWSKVEFFFGDERAVPPEDPDSNYRLAKITLFEYLPGVRMSQVHRMPADAADLDAAASEYEAELRRTLADTMGHDRRPRFDLIWLGMGADGHTASLFPGSGGVEERRRWVVPNWAPSLDAWRMTLTFPVINDAREALMVVTGADKAEAVAAIRSGDRDLPAGRVRAERTVWLMDEAAAGQG